MTKALFFDIDGTLVSFRTHAIPDSTVKAITMAKSKGIKIFISTGRPRQLINNLKAIEHLIDGYITVNGACCVTEGKTISTTPVCMDDVRTILKMSDSMHFASLVVGTDDVIVYNADESVDRVFGDLLNLHDLKKDAPVEPLLEGDILQLSPIIDRQQEAQIVPLLRHSVSVRWCDYFSDVLSADTDKGKGMAAIAAHIGITAEECMAFGDGDNDIPILRAAGTGVAMGNAGIRVKAAADFITDDIDNGGIMKALIKTGIID